jgi:hypothetical protein
MIANTLVDSSAQAVPLFHYPEDFDRTSLRLEILAEVMAKNGED